MISNHGFSLWLRSCYYMIIWLRSIIIAFLGIDVMISQTNFQISFSHSGQGQLSWKIKLYSTYLPSKAAQRELGGTH